jgi:hypothetical protein
MVALSTNVQPVLDIINSWIFVARALVGSIGALAFVLAWTRAKALGRQAEVDAAGPAGRARRPSDMAVSRMQVAAGWSGTPS